MDKHEVSELAYRNGYLAGYKAGRRSVIGGDVVSVVRCGDCSHYAHFDSLNPDKGYCGVTHQFLESNEFCSYGKRVERNA